MTTLWEKERVPDCPKPAYKKKRGSGIKRTKLWSGKLSILRHSWQSKFVRLKLQIRRLSESVNHLISQVNNLQKQVDTVTARMGTNQQTTPPVQVIPSSPPLNPPPGPVNTTIQRNSNATSATSVQQSVIEISPRGGVPQDTIEAVNARISSLHQLVDSILRRINSQQQQIDDALGNISTLRQQLQQVGGSYTEEWDALIESLTPRLNTNITVDTAAGPVFGILVAVGEDYIEILEPDGSLVLIPFGQVLSIS
ncbi:hypothetical protein DFP94_1109 [Fontibacillus phaseoli]|uniref:DUF2642 domain-containing protein n=1 Tax=Fontibacillus phaseoli TaxID=1416533 RepID=A0A369B605_9BACL|nr:hypothetical protein [Fontibacillus phaseoli]RCX16949.1 hypothetical protein DFP94_1109 [Fontibacillus phaseoli]